MARDPDPDRAQDRAEERKHERAETTENVLERADDLLGDRKYPVSSEELAVEYSDEPLDLPNETESLGSVFDRLGDVRFETKSEAKEALYGEITGSAGTSAEYNEERDLGGLDDAAQDDVADSGASNM